MEMTSDHKGVTESGKEVPVGTTVKYLGHLPGCAVSVKLPDGSEEVMHPHCFPDLR